MAQLSDADLAAHLSTGVERQLQVALDNMPGALVYTDDALNIIFAMTGSKKCTACRASCCKPSAPTPAFLRYLAEHGYYGEGDIESLVSRRVESLRNPSGQSFEDHTPDGRWLRILRRRVTAGGTVTVMTDVSEQKRVERDLAAKEA